MKKLLISLSIVFAIALVLNNFFPYSLQSKDQIVNVISTLVILTVAINGINDYGLLLKVVGVVIVIIGLLFTAYTYKKDLFNAALSRLMPNKAITNGDKVIISATENHHFEVEVSINSHKILCLIDTGASGILLDQSMIAAIGVDPTSLNYNIKTSTANGIAYAGAFNIDSLSVGSIHFAKVNVLVNQTPLDTCLLGMSFLNRLKSFEVEDDRLTLVP